MWRVTFRKEIKNHIKGAAGGGGFFIFFVILISKRLLQVTPDFPEGQTLPRKNIVI